MTMVFMLCFILSGALCFAHGLEGMENGKDIPIEVINKNNGNSSDKGSTILASIDGHILTMLISENLGQVSVEITTDTGAMVDCVVAQTPNGLQFYIPNAGSYIVNFTLPNGDEYYGEFEVED